MSNFHFFWSGPFSQWHHSEFIIDNIKFYNAEQAMMYKKAILFEDEKMAFAILKEKSPAIVKSMGRKVKGFKPKTWNKHKHQIVYENNYAKFTQNKHLFDELMKTGSRTLVEASPNDTIWGIGLRASDPDAKDPKKWKGENLLGYILTKLRDDLVKKN